ncbi:hypothetical protein GGX14DRAFT_561584 [Mycena pura]|uniref:Uncharacterized protein n=1 Tax=Mycena pura TaxID=153505 RepID=A0AAD6VLX0_9AGAR|nr:hypothetical protein GGX14DRAFT_561584 [Mycena pura]
MSHAGGHGNLRHQHCYTDHYVHLLSLAARRPPPIPPLPPPIPPLPPPIPPLPPPIPPPAAHLLRCRPALPACNPACPAIHPISKVAGGQNGEWRRRGGGVGRRRRRRRRAAGQWSAGGRDSGVGVAGWR